MWASELVWTQRLEEKLFASARDRTPVVQSVVCHYTDWVTPALQPPSSGWMMKAENTPKTSMRLHGIISDDCCHENLISHHGKVSHAFLLRDNFAYHLMSRVMTWNFNPYTHSWKKSWMWTGPKHYKLLEQFEALAFKMEQRNHFFCQQKTYHVRTIQGNGTMEHATVYTF
jgi:hypothetical protein